MCITRVSNCGRPSGSWGPSCVPGFEKLPPKVKAQFTERVSYCDAVCRDDQRGLRRETNVPIGKVVLTTDAGKRISRCP
jgi:hypothetical protein